jgi:hypothetical protein
MDEDDLNDILAARARRQAAAEAVKEDNADSIAPPVMEEPSPLYPSITEAGAKAVLQDVDDNTSDLTSVASPAKRIRADTPDEIEHACCASENVENAAAATGKRMRGKSTGSRGKAKGSGAKQGSTRGKKKQT